RGDLASADAAIELAAARLPTDGERYLQMIFEATQAELLAARNDPAAADWLERIVRGFEQAQLPDLEIPARLLLAGVWIKNGNKPAAERCLRAAMRMARCDGYARYLAPLNEAMMQLGVVEGALEETGRDVAWESPTMHSYVIRARLGSGAFGEVFHVYDPERNDDFALKRLRLNEIYDPQRRKDLLDSAYCELEAGSRVRHPGVARVWAIGTQADGNLYVVQELVAGHSLADDIPGDNSAPLGLVLRNLLLLANALEALHAAGVIHRDLKPGNVLMRRVQRLPTDDDEGDTAASGHGSAGTAWQPVLVDFGIAHIQGSEHSDPERLAGTLPYMAPEQALGQTLNAQADLYALGVIAFQWLTGTRPLNLFGSTFAEKAQDLARRRPPALSKYRPDVPPDIERLVMQMLEKKPRHRPRSAAAVADSLTRLLPAAELAGDDRT
ncbi:MAG TPA: serine/threonine-protein kinase, partial [Pirellulales bacterium]|nr:serine/threonine-protein kinase [Pirellulales bacterium]